MKVYETPGGEAYKFQHHARNRMKQRAITRAEVENVLDSYDIAYKDKEGNDCFVGYLKNGKRLRVVVRKNTSPLRIITAIVLD